MPRSLLFTPGSDARKIAQSEWARRVIDARQERAAKEQGAVAVDGALVDAAVVARARRIVAEGEGHER